MMKGTIMSLCEILWTENVVVHVESTCPLHGRFIGASLIPGDAVPLSIQCLYKECGYVLKLTGTQSSTHHISANLFVHYKDRSL